MSKVVNKILDNPWLAALSSVIIAALFSVLFMDTRNDVVDIMTVLVPMLVMLTAIVYQLVQKRWLASLGNLLLSVPVFFAVCVMKVCTFYSR